jgi:ribosome-associated protein
MPAHWNRIDIPDGEIEISAIRSQGAGGQHINKVSTAVHLRFDIQASSLTEPCKQRLLKLRDRRINKDGVVIIKAGRYRSQDKNREDALARLQELVSRAMLSPKARKATRPTRGSQKKRLDRKSLHGRKKALRGKILE